MKPTPFCSTISAKNTTTLLRKALMVRVANGSTNSTRWKLSNQTKSPRASPFHWKNA